MVGFTALGAMCIGGWYMLHKTVPPPVEDTMKKNTSLYARLPPQHQITQPFATHFSPTDRDLRILNPLSPMFRKQKVRDEFVDQKLHLWLKHRLENDPYDNLLNERNPNPKYNGRVIPLVKRPYHASEITTKAQKTPLY